MWDQASLLATVNSNDQDSLSCDQLEKRPKKKETMQILFLHRLHAKLCPFQNTNILFSVKKKKFKYSFIYC